MPLDPIAKINALVNVFLGFLLAFQAFQSRKYINKKFYLCVNFVYGLIGLYLGVFYALVFFETLSFIDSILVGRLLVRPVLTILLTNAVVEMIWTKKIIQGGKK